MLSTKLCTKVRRYQDVITNRKSIYNDKQETIRTGIIQERYKGVLQKKMFPCFFSIISIHPIMSNVIEINNIKETECQMSLN